MVSTFLCRKHQKWTVCLPLSMGFFSAAQDGFSIFCTAKVGFFRDVIFNNSSKIWCTKPWFFSFKVSQFFIVYESAEDRNLWAFFSRVKNALSCNIFSIKPNSIVTGMPYLPAKDELVSLKHSSSQGLWKWYNSKVLVISNKQWLHPSFLKKNILWKLLFWFSKVFHWRVFSDWIRRISKFQFWW